MKKQLFLSLSLVMLVAPAAQAYDFNSAWNATGQTLAQGATSVRDFSITKAQELGTHLQENRSAYQEQAKDLGVKALNGLAVVGDYTTQGVVKAYNKIPDLGVQNFLTNNKNTLIGAVVVYIGTSVLYKAYKGHKASKKK